METPIMMRPHRPHRRGLRRVGSQRKPEAFAGAREFGLLGLLLVLLNLPVFLGTENPFSYHPAAVAAGQWWRLLTHPFTHVSPYHFMLDGAAFLALWAGIAGSTWRRIALTAASAAGALILSLALSTEIRTVGLSGLSGVAHGLMVVLAADTACRLSKKDGLATASLVTVGIVFAKAACELFSGQLVFDFMHRGSIGTPIVECHAGGAVAAALFLLSERLISRARSAAAATPAPVAV